MASDYRLDLEAVSSLVKIVEINIAAAAVPYLHVVLYIQVLDL